MKTLGETRLFEPDVFRYEIFPIFLTILVVFIYNLITMNDPHYYSRRTQSLMVNERVIRGIAVQVFGLSLMALILTTRQSTPAALGLLCFLLADFAFRAAGWGTLSLTAAVSRLLGGRLFRFAPRLIRAKPKRFAAGIGAFMSLAAGLLVVLRIHQAAVLLLAVLALFSFLEGTFRFCAGCRIFALLIRLGLAKEDLCTDCVLPGGDGI